MISAGLSNFVRGLTSMGSRASTLPRVIVRHIRGKYDAASDGPDHRNHWRQADHLSPDASLNPVIRKKLRERSRYEIANNPNLDGMVDTLAMDTIGTGPILQLDFPTAELDDLAERIEDAFMDWAEAVDLAGKLLLAKRSWLESGEVFFRLFTNDAIDTPVKLDLRVVEADQCTNQLLHALDPYRVDGIEYDAVGNPTRYHFTKAHPGSGMPDSLITEPVDAKFVIHLFRQKRPGQSRGCPELASALPLGAYERRYTLAAVQAAETAANISAVLHTQANADVELDEVETREEVQTPRGTVVFAPKGYGITQMKAEHPTTTFPDFVRTLIRNMARAIKMPFSIAAGDSSGLNYASGRLEFQAYDKSIDVWRKIIVTKVLRRVFRAWLEEATLIEGLLPQPLRMVGAVMPRATWIWSSRGHVDPVKEVTAQEKRLANHTTSWTEECGREGKDFRKVIKRKARDVALLLRLGMKPADASSGQKGDNEDESEQEEQSESSSNRRERRRAA